MKFVGLTIVVYFLVLTSGCGGVTSGVTEEVDVTGQWSGTLGNNQLITQGCGVFEVSYVLSLTQSGNEVSGESTYDCSGFIVSDVNGTITANELTLNQPIDGVEISLVVDSVSSMSGVMSNPDGSVIADIEVFR